MKLAEELYDTAIKANPKMKMLMEAYDGFTRMAERAAGRGMFAVGFKRKFYPNLTDEDFLQIAKWVMDDGFRCYSYGTDSEETFVISWKYSKNKIQDYA